MIKLESAHIEEVRGIRKLDLNFHRQKFVISGPNGSGKSGVIDAIEFGLTGEIRRLAGTGTRGLSVSEHGPHVDKTRFPDAAFVELQVYLPALGKSATITRKVKSPKTPKIAPPDPDIEAALAELADHPEITLSRRDILRFILVEPSKRSEEIQSLLKLDGIGQIRSALNTAQRKLLTAYQNASAQVRTSRETLRLHLQTMAFSAESLLEVVNKQRKVLNLAAIAELTAETALDRGLSDTATIAGFFNKESGLRDLEALTAAINGFAVLAESERNGILAALAELEIDPALLIALQRRSLVEKGLDLVDGPECPLCDTLWEDEQHLREHLQAKMAKSDEASTLQTSMLRNGAVITETVIRVLGLVTPVQTLAAKQAEHAFSHTLMTWQTDLEALKTTLTTVDGLTTLKDRLTDNWLHIPEALSQNLKRLTQKVSAIPDQSAAVNAQTFLTTAQLRLRDYQDALKKEGAAKFASTSASAAYEVYCKVCEDELDTLYEEVQDDFSIFYREINEDDEGTFTAKLTPSEGQLDFKVNFYERGLFPPGAYHSEGHQDGMGVCLYLALMKRLFGKRFTFALLDDVVMSVDVAHRYQFCKLLKVHFPDTQFIITTHDRLWAEQMKSAGIVSAKTSVAFYSWTIDTGPLVESNQEIWDEIDAALAKGKVDSAAASLRHHLEYVSRHLADQLGATPRFHADGNYELGELLPSILKCMKDLLGKAADAAQSWGDQANKQIVADRKASLSASAGASNVERRAVNSAVHYNEWANFGRNDFIPVVAAFKQLIAQFRCDICDSWVYVSPRHGVPESLRCDCNALGLNLKKRPS